jgi:hypothetical protein
MSGAVSGLSERHRDEARKIIARGAALMLAHQSRVHYTQDARRWQGIDRQLLIAKGHYPDFSDCSSSSTWLLWNGLHVNFGVRDVVNGTNWHAGYTGTILQHGKVVHHEQNIRVGDLAVYGRRGSTGEHVAVCLGGGYVFTHGSEAGPFKASLHYRSDLMCVRRFI